MRRFGALLVLLSLYAGSAACSGDTPPTPAASSLPVVEVRYDGGVIRAEVADDANERALGLGGRTTLAEDAGMLFDLGQTRVPSFWMKDTLIPLDMVWIGEDLRIQGITANVRPEPGVGDDKLRRYSPSDPVRYVLELRAGAAARLGLVPGLALTFDLQ